MRKKFIDCMAGVLGIIGAGIGLAAVVCIKFLPWCVKNRERGKEE